MSTQQLPLGIFIQDDSTMSNFYPGSSNIQMLRAVKALAEGHGEQFIYTYGQHHAGKTHLLQAAMHAATSLSRSAFFVPLDNISSCSKSLPIEGIEHIELICIDNIEKIAGKDHFEEQFFHFFNRLKDSGNKLLISGNCPPNNLKINLQDLKSRLCWGVTFQIHPLSDEDKIHALQIRAKEHGLSLDETVAKFLLRRSPRDMQQLMNQLDLLDKASLATKRKLTIPFVKKTLVI